MVELEALKVDQGAPKAPSTPEVPTKRHRPRRIITWVLVILFTILTPITLVSAWAVRTVTDTNRYVATMQPLATDPVITNFVADKATNEIFSQFHIQQQIANVLPIKADFIAAPITAQLKSFTQTQLRKVTSSQWFANLWEKENHYTQGAAIAILTGKEKSKFQQVQGLGVQLRPVLLQGIDALDARGVTVFNPLKTQLQNKTGLKFELIATKQVSKAQFFFNLAIELRWALLIGTPIIGLAAIAVAVQRRRAAFLVALGGVVGCLLGIVATTFARQAFINAVNPDTQLVATHVFDILFRYLKGLIHWTLLVFVLLALFFWLIGDSTWAVAVRGAARKGSKAIGGAAEQAAHSDAAAKAIVSLERAAAFVARTQAPFRWAGAIIAALFILSNRTIASMIWTLIFLGLYQVLVSVVAWWSTKVATRETADALPSPPKDVDVSS